MNSLAVALGKERKEEGEGARYRTNVVRSISGGVGEERYGWVMAIAQDGGYQREGN